MSSLKKTLSLIFLLVLIFNWQTAEGVFFNFKSKVLPAVTSLANMWNGTGQGFNGGSQADGGVDDYNNGGAAPTDRYATAWTACVSGNSYCGTGDSGAAYRDEATGMVWSKTMHATTYALDDSAGTMTWFGANNCYQTSGSTCTKKVSAKTGCEANPRWVLPHQKQLLQAYIDGSYGNLDAAGVGRYYWSATTVSYGTTYAWYVALSYGYTGNGSKTNSVYVRCVRE